MEDIVVRTAFLDSVVGELEDALERHGAMATISSGDRTVTIEPQAPKPADTHDPVLRRALDRKAQADAALKNVEGGRVGPGMMFCCEAGKKAAITAAKKHVKQWNDFLATRALLTTHQTEMFSDPFEEDDDIEDEEDDEDF